MDARHNRRQAPSSTALCGHDEEGTIFAGAPLLPPIPRRKQILKKRRRALKADRVSLTARLWRTAERQVRDVEERLALASRPGPERERDVRNN